MADHPRYDPPPHQADRARDLSRRRLKRAGATVAVLVAAAAGVALEAEGRPGKPELRGCVAEGGAGGCVAPPAGSLRGVSSLAMSPDGRSVYASAYGSNTLFSFGRDAGGRLTFRGCVADGGAGGCTDPPSDTLAGASGLAVSPGGQDLYVAGGLSRSVTRFSRSGSGALTFGSCTANAGAGGCLNPANDSLVGASAVAVGPGGGDVYVTSFDGGAVSHLRRAADGSLALADCVADAGNFGCVRTPGSALEGAAAITIDSRGRDVYVASLASGSLTHLSRERDGALRFRECWGDRAANGCRRLPTDALLGATGLAMSGDGRSLYVASQIGIVSRFTRKPKSGRVRFSSCIGRDGKGGCAQPKRDSLRQASGVAVAGRDVYVAAQGSDALTRLKVDRRGRLRFVSCVAPKRANRCAGGIPGPVLDGAYGVIARGRDLYAAAPATGAVGTFKK